ncbi:MAG: hypothetical protein OIN90_06145 [Candidatus Methanoperedens sp.]|nr:hypothetical protein [Candidatus Methanoperedens sp. BLZ2]KAB2942441.1 MAG: hypothetical protein F9K14_17040 [Candidatus Methanoperedens sp.]MBZ0177125.1 hypothetical protein [Candidatus Methanoperedens nitroreducens]MCX9077556.1 hypothetical protein [Candidatus Methanoperedens sp.]MCX9087125.1 hypothetical protein [Candidatus Methanoperedens sp.]
MKKPLMYILLTLVVLLSGCVSTVTPVDPSDITISAAPIQMKEFQEKEISVNVMNNATSPIDSVSVKSLEPFTVLSGGNVNIPAREDQPSTVLLSAKIQAPGFKDVTGTTTLTVSYDSGKDSKGNLITKTKSIPVNTIVLPDAKLQFVGFVKDINSISEAEVTTWEASAGDNVTITFSIKNDGRSTIDENTLKVFVDVDNKRMGTNNSLTIGNAMAKGGTSNTLPLQVQVLKNAPNGETDVFVTLMMGDKVIDSKTIKLKVKL